MIAFQLSCKTKIVDIDCYCLIKKNRFVKNEFNISAFSLNSLIYLLFSNSGGIHGRFFCP